MNHLSGVIDQVQRVERLTRVVVDLGRQLIEVILLDSDGDPDLVPQARVDLWVKPAELVIAELGARVSLANHLPVSITQISSGQLLAEVQMEWHDQPLVALVSCTGLEQLNLKTGRLVNLFVPPTALMLRVLSEVSE